MQCFTPVNKLKRFRRTCPTWSSRAEGETPIHGPGLGLEHNEGSSAAAEIPPAHRKMFTEEAPILLSNGNDSEVQTQKHN